MLSLICSHKHKSQLAGLQVLGSLAFMSDKAAEKLLTPRLQAALEVGAGLLRHLQLQNVAANLSCQIFSEAAHGVSVH